MMKTIIIFSCFLALVYGETYDPNNDNFDIEKLVSNKEELGKFAGCFLDRDPCNELSGDFKKDIPEAFEQACAKCTDAQKFIFKRFIEGLKEKIPEDFEAFKQKFDPQGKYYGKLEAVIFKA